MAKDELKKILEWELSLESTDLRSHGWYHGTLPREKAEELVQNDGNFLLRDCISQPGDYVLTCRWKTQPLHFVINKAVSQANTVYEKIQFQFEEDCFDSIPDLVTFYVGNRRPISQVSGTIITRPVTRVLPLSGQSPHPSYKYEKVKYSTFKEATSPSSPFKPHHQTSNSLDDSFNRNFKESNTSPRPQQLFALQKGLLRVGSDPMLSPSLERRPFEVRPHSSQISSETSRHLDQALRGECPPPKPSRVPSNKWSKRPEIKSRPPTMIQTSPDYDNNLSPEHEYCEPFEITEPSSPVLSEYSTREDLALVFPNLNPPSLFDLSKFYSSLLPADNKPLDANIMTQIKLVMRPGPRILASHLTRIDLDVLHYNRNLQLGVNTALELILLPQGNQMKQDLLERTKCVALFVVVTILVGSNPTERAHTLNKWIHIALETKTALGNLYGFTGILLGLTSPHVSRLMSSWHQLRRNFTDSAFNFETKLRPCLRNMQECTNPLAPNTSTPFLHALLELLTDANPNATMKLDSLALHLDAALNFTKQVTIYKKNAELILNDYKYEELLLEIFSTEFHQRFLWGSRGALMDADQRHSKFEQILTLMSKKCEE